MSNLVDPRDSTPANDDQRHAIHNAFDMLGVAPKKRRGKLTQSLHIDQIESGGVDPSILVWMHYQGLVTHVHLSKPRRADAVRACASAVVGPTSIFALTERGRTFGALLLANNSTRNRIALPMGDLTPRFHAERRERHFTWGAHLLKRFSQPPGNQEIILAAFEEEQWADWLDDPLTGGGKIDPKTRARNTIRDLNRWQISYFVHFSARGMGTAVGWALH